MTYFAAGCWYFQPLYLLTECFPVLSYTKESSPFGGEIKFRLHALTAGSHIPGRHR